ncbi:hypothetical protein HJG60_011606 [Phyllostomus discolor]|uniref:Uncharacterized protein n=1 Tax=Phyllostomus discolor TaxID=89673 RepID=A0A834E0X7_9CHIR|nr:hypothetical protein HJG60_011606 [Phyllostomus discolor]
MAKIFQCLYQKYSRILNTAGLRAAEPSSTHVHSASPLAQGRTDQPFPLSERSAQADLQANREAHSSEEAKFSLPSAHLRLNFNSQQKPFSFDFKSRCFRAGPTPFPFLYRYSVYPPFTPEDTIQFLMDPPVSGNLMSVLSVSIKCILFSKYARSR